MLFSIIIPCYNVEKYLSRTLDSILRQEFSDYEVVLINDGSIDNTLAIIKNYCKKHKCIKYIDQVNKGVSAARNAGISVAKGVYISFIDADDTIAPDYFEVLNKSIVKNPDLVFFGFKYYKSEYKSQNVIIKSSPDRILYDILTNRAKCNLWSGIYKAELIRNNGIIFDENTFYNEDREFFIKTILASSPNNIYIIKDILYNYLYTPSSAMRVLQYTKKWFTAFLSCERIYKLIVTKYGVNSKISKTAYNYLLYCFIVHKKRVVKSSEYTTFQELFMPYKWLVSSLPPFVNSPFFYYNLVNIILFRNILKK